MGKELFEFLKGLKKPWLPALAVFAAVLLLAGLFFGGGEEKKENTTDELTALCLQIEGVGRCETLINRDEKGNVSAVAVVCDGAESISVKENLYKLISSLYGVGYNRISILKFSE